MINNFVLLSASEKPILIHLWDFLTGWIDDVAYIIRLCMAFGSRVRDYFSWLPTEVITILSALITVVIIYKVFGREG